MLDIKFIRENPEKVKEGIEKKGVKIDIDLLLKLDEELRKYRQESESWQAELNKISQSKPDEETREKARELKEKIRSHGTAIDDLEKQIQSIMFQIPNLPLDDVPEGRGEADNKEIRKWGKIPKFNFEAKDHVQIAENLDLIDFEKAAKVSGSNFYYLKNEAILLELALIKYALEILSKAGFKAWLTPDLARERFYTGTGYQPKGPEAQIYEIKDSDLGLIATAEITLAGIHADEILKEEELPKRYAGFSHCFRVEAGSYGKYSKGLYRVHQFSKVEMYVFCLPQQSSEMHSHILSLEEKLFQGLGIPYRVVEMCAGDLGAQAAKKFDLEAWMPGRGEWGEITSTSNTTDYQARRLNIRYRKKDRKMDYIHTLNGTAIATSRAMIAILENYQQKDGSVLVPKVLQKYAGFKKISKK